MRGTHQANNGSGGSTVTFYTSTDGTNWTQLGTPQITAGTFATCRASTPVEIGSRATGSSANLQGKVYYASSSSVLGGAATSVTSCSNTGTFICFDPNVPTAAQAAAGSWTASDTTAEPWAVNRNGTNLPSDIATTLTASSVTGLPNGGTARYRFGDGLAYYLFPSAKTILTGTPCTLSLTGFNNTAIAGSYSSTITTWDNSATPVSIDSATTGTVTFASVSNTANASATIDPTFTFTVAPHSGVCGGVAQTGSATATSVNLGHINSSTP